jgi:fumarylacetoacetate (FAA) hydrolase family protein
VGEGFTHKTGDIVTVASAKLGSLTNRMRMSNECEPWTFGINALISNLAGRGLLAKR